jgi:phosphoglycolate phosphatase-like HAD superfamily hydrolase
MAPGKVLVFDLDGVLIDSNSMRDDAFVHIFAAIGCDDRGLVLKIHQDHRGLYRRNKIALIHKHFFGAPPPAEVLDDLLARFAQYVREHIISCPLNPGVREFLEANVGREMFVVSAAEHQEVRWVAEAKGISRFFRGVYGGPTLKAEWLRRICADMACEPSALVFIGDQISDYRAAAEAGVKFVALAGPPGNRVFPPEVCCVDNFQDLVAQLAESREMVL